MQLTTDNMTEGYLAAVRHVLEDGTDVAPRGKHTREVLGFQLVLTDPTRALAVGTGRKLHPGVAAAEALQLVGGFSDPAAMRQVSPHFEKFLDGGVLHAPYGVRVLPQLQRVVERLRLDPTTRQAVVSIWDPVQDLLVDGSRDYPCTTHLQFMCRERFFDAGGEGPEIELALDCHVSMRANDAWHGFPYDVFQFAFLQCTLANVLGVGYGRYFHHATSFHLYDKQLDAAAALAPQPHVSRQTFGIAATSVAEAVVRARALFYGQAGGLDEGEVYLGNAMRKAGVTGSW